MTRKEALRAARRYCLNNLIAWDQAANALLGGDPQETISSRAGKLVTKEFWAYLLCLFLNRLDKHHCKKSIEPKQGSDSVIR